MTYAADRLLCDTLFRQLHDASFDGVGVTRDAYGPRECAAFAIVEAAANASGLATARDAAANLVVTLPGSDPDLPFIAIGSHLDSVPQGGNFDGAAGVLAGLALLASFKERGEPLRRTLKVYALRGEESAYFGRPYLGSSSLFGQLGTADLAATHAVSGRTLLDCMRDVGADADRIARAEVLLDPTSVAAWLELHIEQGPVLVARDLPVGIVTGIRGNIRHRGIACVGEAGHSGAIPRWLRRDAVFATAELVTHLDRHWRTLLERGRDLVVTSGLFGTDPAEHAIARIPGRVLFSFEARSQSMQTLDAFYDLFLSECSGIEEERGVSFVLDRRLDTNPATMDPGWVDRLQRAARRLGISDEVIPSGAGHDATVFAAAGVPSAMIFVRNQNGSHNPHEAMEIDDMLAGISVMRAAVEEAAR